MRNAKQKDSGMWRVSGAAVVRGCYSWSPEWPGRRVVRSSLPAQAPRRRGSERAASTQSLRVGVAEWGRRTGRFRRPHAGGGRGGSSNGRPAAPCGQPGQQEPPPGPAWPPSAVRLAERLGAAEATVKIRGQ